MMRCSDNLVVFWSCAYFFPFRNKVQMWQVLSMLVSSPNGTILYDDVLFNVFVGDDTPLKALVRADLLRVEPGLSAGGDRLKAGSPVMNEAFKRLVNRQAKLKPGMDLLVAKFKIAQEQAKINAIEEELMRIAQTADELVGQQQQSIGGFSGRREKGWHSGAIGDGSSSSTFLLQRQQFLIQLLHDSHLKIVGFDTTRRACEKEIKQIKRVE